MGGFTILVPHSCRSLQRRFGLREFLLRRLSVIDSRWEGSPPAMGTGWRSLKSKRDIRSIFAHDAAESLPSFEFARH